MVSDVVVFSGCVEQLLSRISFSIAGVIITPVLQVLSYKNSLYAYYTITLM
jgi:hypothetical protein